jgi:hypothetical protein
MCEPCGALNNCLPASDGYRNWRTTDVQFRCGPRTEPCEFYQSTRKEGYVMQWRGSLDADNTRVYSSREPWLWAHSTLRGLRHVKAYPRMGQATPRSQTSLFVLPHTTKKAELFASAFSHLLFSTVILLLSRRTTAHHRR